MGQGDGDPMPNHSGQTAFSVAMLRALEQHQPGDRRLFEDPVVGGLLNGASRLMIRSAFIRKALRLMYDGVAPGVYGLQACRTRYIDDVLAGALADGIGQVVILGAGLDTRPYRIPGIGEATVIEVDLPRVQEIKRSRIQRLLGSLPGHVRFLPMDFNTQALGGPGSGGLAGPGEAGPVHPGGSHPVHLPGGPSTASWASSPGPLRGAESSSPMFRGR